MCIRDRAHSGAGAAWTNLASMGAEPARRANAAALAAAVRALAIDPELHEALSVRAYVTYRDGLDPVAAESLYRQGLRLNPSATYLRLGLAWLVVYDLAGEKIPFMADLETWQNFAIGFGLAVVGLLMTMNWR